jgi:hypothetical protein
MRRPLARGWNPADHRAPQSVDHTFVRAKEYPCETGREEVL